MQVIVDEKKGTLTIVASLNNPPVRSKSGKTDLVVTTNGALKTQATVGGKALTVNLNAYVPAS